MTAGPGYGTAFAAWRDACGPLWDAHVRHGFVAGLGDGSLPRPAYLHYLAQDYVFLTHFSRAWALAVVKAGDLTEMQAAAATVHALLHEEMPLHQRVCAEAGIGAEALLATPEAPANLAYTRYVLEAGYTGDFLDLMAALAPCVLGYGEIGERLLRERPGGDGPYADWIATYGGADYQALCRDTGALIDRALRLRLGPEPRRSLRWPALEARFAAATALEVEFWNMGLRP